MQSDFEMISSFGSFMTEDHNNYIEKLDIEEKSNLFLLILTTPLTLDN